MHAPTHPPARPHFLQDDIACLVWAYFRRLLDDPPRRAAFLELAGLLDLELDEGLPQEPGRASSAASSAPPGGAALGSGGATLGSSGASAAEAPPSIGDAALGSSGAGGGAVSSEAPPRGFTFVMTLPPLAAGGPPRIAYARYLVPINHAYAHKCQWAFGAEAVPGAGWHGEVSERAR